ncbi:DNA repair protein Rad52, partial [bacterium M00.F.Ca.ET.168.01.1.1]
MIHLAKLRDPFPPDIIEWRVGSTSKDKSKGLALAYITARDVMQRLDEVCGPENWQCDYPHAGSKTVCRIGIKVGEEWIW